MQTLAAGISPSYPHAVATTDAEDDSDDDRAEVDEVAQFVSDLKQLWVDNGSPPFTALASRTGVSKSSLNDAVNRTDRPPSERTLAAFVGAIAPEKVGTWTKRRAELLEELNPSASQLLSPVATQVPPRARWPWIAALVFGLLMSVVGFAVGRATAPQDEPVRAGLEDGDDPIEAGCVPTAATVAKTSLDGVGTLQLLYSTTCNAYWARIERVDGRAVGNKLVSEVFIRRDASRAERAVDPDVTGAYTYLLVREDPEQTVCARGSIWDGSKEHKLPEAC